MGDLISAAGGLIGGIWGAAAQGKRDHDARNFALMQGDIEWQRAKEGFNMQQAANLTQWQRQNAYNKDQWLAQNAYNQQLWDQQNRYNSPAAQMQRYKEAGLNPHLIYGQSNTAGSVQTANLETDQMAPVSQAQGGRPSNWQPQAPKFNFADGLLAVASFRNQAAQTDNLEEMNENIKVKRALDIARATGQELENIGRGYKNTKDRYAAKLAEEGYNYSMDALKESARKLTAEADYTINKNIREAALNSSHLLEAAERIKKSQGERLTEIERRKILEIQRQMYENNTTPHDNFIWRNLAPILNKDLPKEYKWNGKWLNDKW